MTLHTFITLTEANSLDALAEDGKAIERAFLTNYAVNAPKLLKEEQARHQYRIRQLADREVQREKNRVAREQAAEIMAAPVVARSKGGRV